VDKDEIRRYLANLYCVAASDGKSERAETTAIERIGREVRAGYFELKQAEELARTDGLQIDVAARWSDRIRNLEDMFFLAYGNSVLDPGEKSIIVDYANSLGIDQNQLNLVKQEAKRRHDATA